MFLHGEATQPPLLPEAGPPQPFRLMTKAWLFTHLSDQLIWVSPISGYLLLSALLGASLPPPLPPPPARFLLPHPAVRSEFCAYDTSVCCHGNRGGLRLERRDQAPPLPELPPQLVPAGREQLASGTKAQQPPGRGKGQGNPSGAPQLAHWDLRAKRLAEVGSRG